MRIDLSPYIKPGDLVFCAQLGGAPQSLVKALIGQAERLGGVRFLNSFPLDPGADRLTSEGVRYLSMDGFGVNAKLFQAGKLEIVPAHFSDYARLFHDGLLVPDVVFCTVTPADEAGRRSLGLSLDHVRDAMECARVVLAEENSAMPWTHGDSEISGDFLTKVFPATQPPDLWQARAPGPVDHAIAEQVARLVPNGATFQYGVGATPDAIARALVGHKELGCHSGSLADSYVELAEAGAISNRHKEIDQGFTVVTSLYGSQRLLDFAHRNPQLLMRRGRYTHSAEVLRNFRKFYAINSALEVDLTGQVGSEAVDGRYIGAVGGQVNFHRAAFEAPQGRAIITLGATAGKAKRPRIVPRLSGPVTTVRADADVVITEFGMAELRGKTLVERAEAMIAIAHPDHRADLRQAIDTLA
ncbi:MAG: acetyl-CoA hydrolase [Alphaproteobacteria bacterium]|nr:acetyl-CoA hydrolase [Alphaproteobacteria bacterium]MCB9929991.1 acetyl-CoA hydrolase [Alphaproteobacteria bacterium]